MAEPRDERGQEEPSATTTATTASAKTGGTDLAGQRGVESNGAPDTGLSAGRSFEALRIDVMRSVFEHEDRASFWQFCHNATLVVLIVLSSGSFAAFVEGWKAAALIFPLVATLIAALDSAIGYSAKAQDHLRLRHRFYDLLSDIDNDGATQEDIMRAVYKVYADEPPTMAAVSSLAHNHAYRAVRNVEHDYVVVTWWQRKLRHLRSYAGVDFPLNPEFKKAYPEWV